MHKKFILSLLSSQILFTSLISLLGVVSSPAQAAQRVVLTTDGRSCISHPHGDISVVCTRVTKSQRNLIASRIKANTEVVSAQPCYGEGMMLLFSEEESNAA